jgi:hypothetical protein
MPLFKIGSLCFIVLAFATAKADVRHVEAKKDQIIAVKTAVGIATIIQVPDRPTSVVIGDQSAFKVEYLDRAITIKPLIPNARTNLYIYTDWQRYNIKLVPTDKNQADFVVYLQPKTIKQESFSIRWKDFKNHLKSNDLRVDVLKLGSTKNGLYLIEFDIQSLKKESFKPEWIWLTQNGRTIPIHKLALNELKLKPDKKVSGLIITKKEDMYTHSPIRFEIRRDKTSYLTIMEPRRW